ncbi:MAG TPA: hypothetical protein VEF89_18865 [Solirubrobacteraceae bacterium]|nr:hypothetical protein [Solirubrobacteraceae bacterium]
MPPTAVHFNGSVNLPDTETVMREISSRIPHGVRRMTDGETGDRNYWINFQIRKFEQMPEFETVSVGQAYETAPDAPPMPQLRLTEGASAEMIDWPNLGYADEYTRSFAIFERMQNEGTIPAGVRFQLQYPTPLASMAGQPESLQMQVDLVNAASSAAPRPLNFVSFTVPQGRNDIAYFEPLGGLRTGADTELYFALVPYHPDDQAPGTTAEQIENIDAALINSPAGPRHWGICTECGMGRVAARDVPRLLDLHSQILASSRG